MAWNGQEGGIAGAAERGFELTVGGRRVPGVYWQPQTGGERLVLLGHGGTTHKRTEYIVHVAGLLAQKGIASMAIDGPGHGDRDGFRVDTAPDSFAKAWHAGGGTDAVVEDWHEALNFIEAEQGARPTGWWGLSMGTMMGLPVSASDDRVRVALLGLMGTWGPNGDDLARMAPDLSCPVRFLVQWHDEVVPRDDCLALFDRLGSKKKTLHANPGAHSAVPQVEIKASVDYLDRYLA